MFIYKTPGTGPMPHALYAFGRSQRFFIFIFHFFCNEPLDFQQLKMNILLYLILILTWRDGDRYATLEKLQQVLALESGSASKPIGDGGSATATAEELHSCCCLLPCPPECSRNRTKSQTDLSSTSSLSALHAALLGKWTRYTYKDLFFRQSNNRWPAEGHYH